MARERPVAKEPGLERAAHDVVDVHVAHEPAAVAVPDEERGLVVAGGPVQVGGEPLLGVSRVEPRAVQVTACSYRRDELGGVIVGWRGDHHIHPASMP